MNLHAAVRSPSAGNALEEVLAILAMNSIPAGVANLISLAPIKSRLGERWLRKREQVWAHVEAFLNRQLRTEDMVVRLDDLNLLVVQPGRDPLAAQITCVRASSELMKFFIGDASTQSVDVRIVERVDESGVVTRAIEPDRLKAMVLATGPDLSGPARESALPLLTRLGRKLEVRVALDPLWSLAGGPRVIGHYSRVGLSDADTGEPLSVEARRRLQSGDLVEVDICVLQGSLALRAASPSLFGSLILPVSYSTLANSSTRYQLMQVVQRLAPAERRSFGWEIVGLETGVPAGRLSELVGMARAQTRGVICQLEPSLANAEKVRAAGATLSIAPPDQIPFTERGLVRLGSHSALVFQAVKAVMAHEVPQGLLPLASSAGVTHCTLANTQ